MKTTSALASYTDEELLNELLYRIMYSETTKEKVINFYNTNIK